MAGHFTEIGLLPELCKGIDDLGWSFPTDIQSEAIPAILGGGDVLLSAETGSGKTGAFCLPVVQIVKEFLDSTKNKNYIEDKNMESNNFEFQISKTDSDTELEIDNSGLICSSKNKFKWQGGRSVIGVCDCLAYYEVTVISGSLCRVGWSTKRATLELGKDYYGFGFGATGMKSYGGKFETYGTKFGPGDIIGCFVDFENGVSFSVNGKSFGISHHIPKKIVNEHLYPTFTLKEAKVEVNFGKKPFAYPPKNGFVPIFSVCQTKLSAKSFGIITNKSAPSAVILEPSRELATQTLQNLQCFCKILNEPKPKLCLLIGGHDPNEQIRVLRDGVDILVATPAKFKDFLSKRRVVLDQIRFIVLDEADTLFGMDMKGMEEFWKLCPKFTTDSYRLQTILSSATVQNSLVSQFMNKYLPYASWIDLKGKDSVPETVHHVVCYVDPTKDKSWKNYIGKIKTDDVHIICESHVQSSGTENSDEYSYCIKIMKFLYTKAAIEINRMDQVIIFCRTKLDCSNMEQFFKSVGGGPTVSSEHQFSCRSYHSGKPQIERDANLADFKAKKFRLLICTAIAARGLDIRGVPYVICVTIPEDKHTYIHMVGRVGRAERMGLAMTFVGVYPELAWYHGCNNVYCTNRKLVKHGGCCKWYNDKKLLAEIEEHLMDTIEIIQPDMIVPTNIYDGKVVYGKKKESINETKPSAHFVTVQEKASYLCRLECQVQSNFFKLSKDINDIIQ